MKQVIFILIMAFLYACGSGAMLVSIARDRVSGHESVACGEVQEGIL